MDKIDDKNSNKNNGGSDHDMWVVPAHYAVHTGHVYKTDFSRGCALSSEF